MYALQLTSQMAVHVESISSTINVGEEHIITDVNMQYNSTQSRPACD